MNVRYRVELSQAERDELTAMLGGGKHAARKVKRAQICWPPMGVAATRRLPGP
jgi:hypothetical protein